MLGCALPMRLGHLAGGEEVHALVRQHADGGIDQRGVDKAALAGALALRKRGEDADHRIDAGEDVGHRHAGAGRLAIGGAGEAHEAADALRHQVVAGARGIGAVLAEAGDRAIDQPRAVRREALVVEPEFGEPADLEVLDQHVRARRKLLDDAPCRPRSRNRTRSSVCRGWWSGNRRRRDGRRPCLR